MANKKNNNNPDEVLQAIANGDFGVNDQLVRMLGGSYENSGLDPETFMLVRMAALVAVDAPPTSWLLNLAVSKELEIAPGKAVGILTAVAPVVGTARIVSAAGNILKALALAKKMREDE